MLSKNNVQFIGCEANFEEATHVLFGAPFDGTTSYRPGTRFGPAAVRMESFGLETYSPYQQKDLVDASILDSGDLEFPFGNTKKVLEQIEERTTHILRAGKVPMMIGGEHLVTLGAVRAAHHQYENLHIIHFDAHTDLRDDYLGERLSHATVLRRCHDLVGDGKIFQFGIRSGDRPEFDWANEGHTTLQKFNFEQLQEALHTIGDAPVYFTIDLDVLDPSEFPGTGTPEAGGVRFTELLHAMINVCTSVNVVACDVNELAPIYDPTGRSTALAGKVIREFLLALQK
ncbi:agmatinase [Kurthia senegalensis]|uniref:agmatinase n=1 Tax=Kurthia senegalensis TaxID=1033740 RepID=UPI0002884035|nr:agmatinase [Kurthia senegalensis]